LKNTLTYVDYKRNLISKYYKNNQAKANQFGVRFLLENFNCERQDRTEFFQMMLDCNIWGGINYSFEYKHEDSCVLLGLKPSLLHLGHMSLFKEFIFYCNKGFIPFIVLGNHERLLEGNTQDQIDEKIKMMDDLLECNMIMNYTTINDSLSSNWDFWLSLVENHISLRKVKQLFGWTDDITFSQLKMVANMVVSFLSPQFYLKKPIKTIIPCGENELPSLELTKIVAKKIGLVPPSVSLRMMLPSLRGSSERMSTKNMESTIFFNDDASIIKKKLMKSATGGREVELHKAMGGDVEKCIFLQSIASLASEYDEITRIIFNCLNGKLCGKCKDDYFLTLKKYQ